MKNKFYIFLLSVFILPAIMFLAACGGNNPKLEAIEIKLEEGTNYTLEDDKITVLFGSKVVLTSDDFVVTLNFSDSTKKIVECGENGYEFSSNLPNDDITPVGKYTVSFTYQEKIKEIDVVVSARTVDISNVALAQNEFTYDGSEKTVVLASVPEGVSVSYENNKATNAGEYEVTVNFTAQANYEINGTTTKTLPWEINKKAVEIGNVELAQNEFTYDGNEKIVVLANVPEGVSVSYENNKATNAGGYEVTVNFTAQANYEIDGTATKILPWKINKKVVEIGNVALAQNEFTYDGNEKTVVLASVPEGVSVSYENNKATNAGNYEVTVTFTAEENYKIVGEATKVLPWSITKNSVAVGKLTLIEDGFNYDGSEKVVAIDESVLPEGVSYTITGNRAINAGNYVAHIVLSAEGKTIEGDSEQDLPWSIAKAQLTAKVKNSTITYGKTPNGAGVEFEGLLGNDTENVVEGKLQYDFGGYEAGDDVGEYVLSATGLNAQNYDITFENGTLKVIKAKFDLDRLGKNFVGAFTGHNFMGIVENSSFNPELSLPEEFIGNQAFALYADGVSEIVRGDYYVIRNYQFVIRNAKNYLDMNHRFEVQCEIKENPFAELKVNGEDVPYDEFLFVQGQSDYLNYNSEIDFTLKDGFSIGDFNSLIELEDRGNNSYHITFQDFVSFNIYKSVTVDEITYDEQFYSVQKGVSFFDSYTINGLTMQKNKVSPSLMLDENEKEIVITLPVEVNELLFVRAIMLDNMENRLYRFNSNTVTIPDADKIMSLWFEYNTVSSAVANSITILPFSVISNFELDVVYFTEQEAETLSFERFGAGVNGLDTFGYEIDDGFCTEIRGLLKEGYENYTYKFFNDDWLKDEATGFDISQGNQFLAVYNEKGELVERIIIGIGSNLIMNLNGRDKLILYNFREQNYSVTTFGAETAVYSYECFNPDVEFQIYVDGELIDGEKVFPLEEGSNLVTFDVNFTYGGKNYSYTSKVKVFRGYPDYHHYFDEIIYDGIGGAVLMYDVRSIKEFDANKYEFILSSDYSSYSVVDKQLVKRENGYYDFVITLSSGSNEIKAILAVDVFGKEDNDTSFTATLRKDSQTTEIDLSSNEISFDNWVYGDMQVRIEFNNWDAIGRLYDEQDNMIYENVAVMVLEFEREGSYRAEITATDGTVRNIIFNVLRIKPLLEVQVGNTTIVSRLTLTGAPEGDFDVYQAMVDGVPEIGLIGYLNNEEADQVQTIDDERYLTIANIDSLCEIIYDENQNVLEELTNIQLKLHSDDVGEYVAFTLYAPIFGDEVSSTIEVKIYLGEKPAVVYPITMTLCQQNLNFMLDMNAGMDFGDFVLDGDKFVVDIPVSLLQENPIQELKIKFDRVYEGNSYAFITEEGYNQIVAGGKFEDISIKSSDLDDDLIATVNLDFSEGYARLYFAMNGIDDMVGEGMTVFSMLMVVQFNLIDA